MMSSIHRIRQATCLSHEGVFLFQGAHLMRTSVTEKPLQARYKWERVYLNAPSHESSLSWVLPSEESLYSPVVHRDYDLQVKPYAAASGTQATNPSALFILDEVPETRA